MTRREVISAIVATLTVGLLGKAKPTSHTDFEYAHVEGPMQLSPKAHPRPKDMYARRDTVIPYLNGKAQKGVQEANAKEGWMVIAVRDEGTLRLDGDVQILWATPERRKEFEAAPEVM